MYRTVELSVMLAFYGAFLTQRQRHILLLRLDEDFSLAEIAQAEGISRQAAHDIIQRAAAQLYEMEEKLKLMSRTRAAEECLNRLSQDIRASSLNDNEKSDMLNEINLIRTIWE